MIQNRLSNPTFHNPETIIFQICSRNRSFISEVESTFDFSQVSFAQPVADDDFEDAFYASRQIWLETQRDGRKERNIILEYFRAILLSWKHPKHDNQVPQKN